MNLHENLKRYEPRSIADALAFIRKFGVSYSENVDAEHSRTIGYFLCRCADILDPDYPQPVNHETIHLSEMPARD